MMEDVRIYVMRRNKVIRSETRNILDCMRVCVRAFVCRYNI